MTMLVDLEVLSAESSSDSVAALDKSSMNERLTRSRGSFLVGVTSATDPLFES